MFSPEFSRMVKAPEFGGTSASWVNSAPLTLAGLSGQVVLVDFFDYTCVNCIRTLPYLRGWVDRYGRGNFKVIGIHSPEFSFGKRKDIVERNLARLGINWPVLLDSSYTIWERFSNSCWPAEYLIDTKGYLRYTHFGEGNYEVTESSIQSLLREATPNLELPPLLEPVRASDRPGARCLRSSNEIYLGRSRGNWALIALESGLSNSYHPLESPREGLPVLKGDFEIRADYLEYRGRDQSSGRLMVQYTAKELNIVMGMPECSKARVGVIVDGGIVSRSDFGNDLQGGNPPSVLINDTRMYEVMSHQEFGRHVVEFIISDPGWQAYALTFPLCTSGEES